MVSIPQTETMATRAGPIAPGVAFITGGARGLGNAVAVSFAKEGARGVVIVDIQDEKTLEAGKAAVESHGTKVTCCHGYRQVSFRMSRLMSLVPYDSGRRDERGRY